MVYRLGTHETGNYMELSARTGQQIILDSQDDGPNWDFMGSMCVVAAYQLWENHYRARIARHLSRTGTPLCIPIFGDLRRFRRAIIHNRSRWSDDLVNLECFSWEPDAGCDSDEVHFPKSVITEIWWKMRLALDQLRRTSEV